MRIEQMSLQTTTARTAAAAPLTDAPSVQARIEAELAAIAGMMVADEAQPSDATRRAAMTGLLGRWSARRAARRATRPQPGAALH
jgi:hypothetical protein